MPTTAKALTPLETPGKHSLSFENTHVGLEVRNAPSSILKATVLVVKLSRESPSLRMDK